MFRMRTKTNWTSNKNQLCHHFVHSFHQHFRWEEFFYFTKPKQTEHETKTSCVTIFCTHSISTFQTQNSFVWQLLYSVWNHPTWLLIKEMNISHQHTFFYVCDKEKCQPKLHLSTVVTDFHVSCLCFIGSSCFIVMNRYILPLMTAHGRL